MLKPTLFPLVHTKNGRISRVSFHTDVSWNSPERNPQMGDIFMAQTHLLDNPDLFDMIYLGGFPFLVYDINVQEGTAMLLFCTDRVEHLFARIAWLKTVLKCEFRTIIDTIQKQYGAWL